MALFSAHCIFRQNFSFAGKDKLAGGIANESSNYRIPTSPATHAPTPAVASVVALFAVSASFDSSVVRYLEDDL